MTIQRVERLSPVHDLSKFDAGAPELDHWLRTHARPSDAMDSSRTFVLVTGSAVIGYFSLTMGAVRKEDAPRSLVRGRPGYPVGIVLITRLALDESHHGQSLGSLLLAESLRRAVTAGEAAAARLVVVDAINDDAANFYAHHGFIAVPEQPRRLFRRMKDIRTSIDAAIALAGDPAHD